MTVSLLTSQALQRHGWRKKEFRVGACCKTWMAYLRAELVPRSALIGFSGCLPRMRSVVSSIVRSTLFLNRKS